MALLQQAVSKSGYLDAGDDIKIYYEVRGEGPAVVLIHSEVKRTSPTFTLT